MTIFCLNLFRIRNVPNRSCRENQNTYLWQYCVWIFLESEMFQIEVVEKIKTHILYSIIFSTKSMQAHARTLTHTEICSSYCFSTVTMVLWRRLKCYVIRTLPVFFYPLVGFMTKLWGGYQKGRNLIPGRKKILFPSVFILVLTPNHFLSGR
jgi:hypothetical protein